MADEKWKEIPNTDGYYEVSNKGRVRSWHNNTNTPGRRDNPIILSEDISNAGYCRVNLRTNKGKRHFSVHRLVAKLFVDNPKNKSCVNHKDGDKTNNNVENIEWVTRSENQIHAHKNGLMNPPKGENHWSTNLTKEDVLDIRAAYATGWFTQKEIADAYGIHRTAANMIINHKRWRHV